MDSYVQIKSGKTTQGFDLSNRVFQLLQQPRKDKLGIFIVVNGTSYNDMKGGRVRVYVDSVSDFMPISKEEFEKEFKDTAVAISDKTDEEIVVEIEETFEILTEMTRAVAGGVVKGLVVSGPAGIGKSFTVEKSLRDELDVMAKLNGKESMYECIHGNMSASVLYEKLYRFSGNCQVLVFDDCDGVLYDEDALNILKAALDSRAVRKIYWGTNSQILERKDIPNSFDYKGSIIFITNVDFTQVRSPRIANHLEAIVSRCHYMNLGINSLREKIIHIKNTVEKQDMLSKHGFDQDGINEVMDYVMSNSTKLREVSLRSVIKTADLKRAMPERWRKFADKNILKET